LIIKAAALADIYTLGGFNRELTLKNGPPGMQSSGFYGIITSKAKKLPGSFSARRTPR
jgi:hypothetical protein